MPIRMQRVRLAKLVHEFGAQRTIDSAGIEMVFERYRRLDRAIKN